MLKAVNSHKSSSFQQFKDDIIKKLRKKPVIQDLDLIRLSGNNIKFLIEVKRSFSTDWKPYIKKFHPNRHYDKLDDFNYRALFCLARKIPAEVLIFYYIKEKLTEYGIKPFKITSIDLDTKPYRFYSQYEIETYLKTKHDEKSQNTAERNLRIYKDQRNPNISNNTQNIFAWLAQNEVTHHFYYVESDGIWTMLMSDSKTSEPIWLYIEVNLTVIGELPTNLKTYFEPQITIAQSADIDFSIICYNENLTSFEVLELKDGNFVKNTMSREQFTQYYASYVNKNG